MLVMLSPVLVFIIIFATAASASIRFANVISSSMVLQSAPSSSVVFGFADDADVVTADVDGAVHGKCDVSGGLFQCTFPPIAASLTAHNISVATASSRLELHDVLFGAVLLCSGQSNMAFPVGDALNGTADVADSVNYPFVRLYFADHTYSPTPQEDNGSPYQWRAASPEIVAGFSAVCYYSGRDLYKYLDGNTPIGLVLASVSGTAIELWSDPTALAQCAPSTVNRSSELFNAMIHPLRKMRFSSVVWFQGEQNAFNPPLYQCRFPAMIQQWRRTLSSAQLPFYWSLLGPIPYHDGWTQMRFAQLNALFLANAGFANPIDLGDAKNNVTGQFAGPVHFRNKSPLGERFARRIAHDLFAINVVADGPAPSQVIVAPSESTYVVTILFDNSRRNEGLHFAPSSTCDQCCTQSGSPFAFILHDETQIAANYTISFDKARAEYNVTVSSPRSKASSLRFLLSDVQSYPQCALSNAAAIPAAPLNISLTAAKPHLSAQ